MLDISRELSNNEYNKEPVFYCKHCLSLKIRSVSGMDYCDSCSATDIEQCNIEDWENMYKHKYGHKFLDNF
jgi:hypothetical protein